MWIVLGILAMAGLGGVGIWTNYLFNAIVQQVNRTLPEEKRFSFWEQRSKYGEVLRMHAELFPESHLRRDLSRSRWIVFAGSLCLFLIAFLVTSRQA